MNNIEHRGVDRRQIKHLSPNQFELQYLNLEAITAALVDLNERWGLGHITEIDWAAQTVTRTLDKPGRSFPFVFNFNTHQRNNKHRVTVRFVNNQVTVDAKVPGDSFLVEQKEQV